MLGEARVRELLDQPLQPVRVMVDQLEHHLHEPALRLVAAHPHRPGGSGIIRPLFRGSLAQLVEQRTLNPLVRGSSPRWPTSKPRI